MQYHQTFLRCSQTTATITFTLIGILFCLAGCAQLYKLIGLTDEQTQDQLAEDQKTIIRTITITRNTAADIITTAIAGAGAIASAFLTKRLGTERKMTKALITGIENAPQNAVKQTVKANALSAGVETKLHARVKSLT